MEEGQHPPPFETMVFCQPYGHNVTGKSPRFEKKYSKGEKVINNLAKSYQILKNVKTQ